MIFVGLAALAAFIGMIPALLGKKFQAAGILFVIYFFVGWLIFYLGMPSLNYPLGGGVGILTVVWLLVASIIVGVSKDEVPVLSSSATGVGAIVLLFTLFSGCGACNTGKYATLIGSLDKNEHTLKHWTQQTEEVSPTHLRVVPIEHAMSIAKTALNQHSDDQGNIVGSQFVTLDSNTTLQKVNGEMVYVVPLDFRNWGTYNGTGGVPGYVLVNAEDQHTTPRYMNGWKMVYTPNAYWGNNLERHLYTHGYSDKILMDYSFEVNDSMKPYWVVSVCHASIGWWGVVVDGVAVVDPETGDIQYYDKLKAPEWIDRIIPESVVQNNISYWGKWAQGYWNNTAVGAQNNLRKPESTVLNYGKDGSCWYVTPVTSNNGNDHSMTDLIYTNSRTGESKRFAVAGATEEKITATVDATIKFQNLHAAAIIYENVADRMTAIVPILAEDHSIRGLALVDVTTKSMSWDPDPMQALMKYQNSLGSISSAIGTDNATLESEIIAKVTRVSNCASSSGSIYYLYFEGSPHIYSVSQTYREIVITNPGDSVHIKFLDMESEVIAVNDFDNLTVRVHKSKNEKEVHDKLIQHRTVEKVNAMRVSTKNSIRNGDVPDSVLDNMAKNIATQKKKQ